MTRTPLMILLLLVPLAGNAATIQLCKGYGGGRFWSSAPCGTQQATVERIVTVPDGMPFEQQVELGRQAQAEAERLTAPAAPPAARSRTAKEKPAERSADAGSKASRKNKREPEPQVECRKLDERIRHLDAQARQPQSAAKQDRIAADKRKARDRQFALRCR